MTKIDLTQILKDAEGGVSYGNFRKEDEKGVITQERRMYRLKDCFKTILLAKTPDMEESFEDDLENVEISDSKEKANKKMLEILNERYFLFLKIRDVDEVELTQKEKDLIAKLAVPKLSILFAGQVVSLINNK